MQIHTVKRGETVFHIARRYKTSPVKIIENNALLRADTLSVGEELMILEPTRSYTVRGGETIAEICERFLVKKGELIRLNPALAEDDRLRPGMNLTLKLAPPKYGTAANLGYIREHTTLSQIDTALPYLSYFVFDAAVSDGEQIRFCFNCSCALDAVTAAKKIPLLRVRAQKVKEEFYQSVAYRQAFMDTLVEAARKNGFLGIVLESNIMEIETCPMRDAFLVELRKRMIGSDLILFCECLGRNEFSDLADANILLPSYLFDENDFSREHRLCHAASLYESQKTFVGLPSYALDNGTEISREQMREILYRTKTEIKNEGGLLRFDFCKFRGGAREEHAVKALSLRCMDDLLSMISEYGFMGTAVEVSFFHASVKLLLACAFSGIEYSFTVL